MIATPQVQGTRRRQRASDEADGDVAVVKDFREQDTTTDYREIGGRTVWDAAGGGRGQFRTMEDAAERGGVVGGGVDRACDDHRAGGAGYGGPEPAECAATLFAAATSAFARGASGVSCVPREDADSAGSGAGAGKRRDAGGIAGSAGTDVGVYRGDQRAGFERVLLGAPHLGSFEPVSVDGNDRRA